MVHPEDGSQGAFLIQEQTLVVRLVLYKQVDQDADVLVQVVELILRDSLAYRDEQAWVEYRLVGELMQSTKVLHVGTLSDNLDGLGITQV